MSTPALEVIRRPARHASLPRASGHHTPAHSAFEPRNSYRAERGVVLLSGVQAAVRGLLDQRRADRLRGINTATLASGYQGSPLGTFDQELGRIRELAHEHSIHHVPGLNEELGATAVWGSQLAATLPNPRHDGVVGVWYGKAPGLDRAGDAIRHGNWVGAGEHGGVLALVGDDPGSKSSTLPSASEAALADFGIPTLYPGNVQEVVDHVLHAIALSRVSGLWSALKMVTDVADGIGTVEVGPDRVLPLPISSNGDAPPHRPHANLLAPHTLELERNLVEVRLPRASRYAAVNGLNTQTVPTADAWLGIVAAGKTYHDLMQAAEDLGLDERELERLGVRVLKLGMIYPLDGETARSFAAGLDEILVVEEKRPFLETQLKEVLYGTAAAPRIVGRTDERGSPLLPGAGELDSVTIASALVSRLAARADVESMGSRLAILRAATENLEPPSTARTPFFCSGCPHNRSTKAPDESLVGIGIGCHTMVLLDQRGKGDLAGVTQMGGEGAQWIGMAPFTGAAHFVQNLGDGTFFHSGSLAIRFAVAAGADVTFKLLYNGAVAMTGGQEVEGAIPVPELTRLLEAEGVARTIVTTEDTRRYRRVKLAANAEVRDRSELLEAQRELASVSGVTVLIHDQACAAELRRLRKRGEAPEPEMRVAVNERVCEGCGDCGEKSSCLSVRPIETEFGTKTRIHQPSCNKDYSCLEGDCPAFVSATGTRSPGSRLVEPPNAELPEPQPRVLGDDVSIRLPGIGGTGVVSVNAILANAAALDGKHVRGLDQTGLSQKGGPVISDLRISTEPIRGSSKASPAGVDLLLAFDLLTATAPRSLAAASSRRTIAVVSTSAVATGAMIGEPGASFPRLSKLIDRIEARTRAGENFYLDAEALAQMLFDDSMPANTIALGAAYQWGAIPLSLRSLEAALAASGSGAERNLAAFAWGRACVALPDLVESVTRPPVTDEATRAPNDAERELIATAGAPAGGELARLLEVRVPELSDYQDQRYARSYVDAIAAVRRLEGDVRPGATRIAEAVARNLFKLMAYKDEYEVARLHLLEAERMRLSGELGPGARIYWHLHPPLLRALGLKRKLRFGRWFRPALATLRAMRRLRGRLIDPFGHTRVRRTERALIGEYREALEQALGALDEGTYDQVAALAELPEMVRGYEHIKLTNVERYRAEISNALTELGV